MTMFDYGNDWPLRQVAKSEIIADEYRRMRDLTGDDERVPVSSGDRR